jgi:pilus assembly protein CpaC
MHRKLFRPGWLWSGVLLALVVSGPPMVRGQDTPPPRPGALIVPINGTVRLRMASGKPIRTVTNPKDSAVNIRTVVGDPTTVLVIGQQPDVTRIELEDVDGKKEVYEVIVQADIEYLRTQLRRGVPTANLEPIPTGNNSVILTGTLARAEDAPIAQAIAQSVGFTVVNAMRVGGVQQVQLDVAVASVDRTLFRAMAFNFLINSKNFFLGSTVGQAVAEPGLLGVGSPLGPTFLGQALSGVPGAPNGQPTNLLFGVIHSGWGLLNFLQALKNESVTKLLAEPRLMTLSGRPASFLAGGEQAVPVPAGLGQIGVQFEEFGTRLNFIPIVLGNGKIRLEVEPEVSRLDPASGVSINGTVVPGRITDRVNTTVELEDGQTFVIGGLIQRNMQATIQRVPVLGEIPYLSTFFTSKSITETEEELLILVTPHLVDAESCAQRPNILPGQETRTPDDCELFLEGILEAPRGQRKACEDHQYVAPYKNSPSASVYPCYGGLGGLGGLGGHGGPGCGAGGCAGGDGAAHGDGLYGAPPHGYADSQAAPLPQAAVSATPATPVTPANPAPAPAAASGPRPGALPGALEAGGDRP